MEHAVEDLPWSRPLLLLLLSLMNKRVAFSFLPLGKMCVGVMHFATLP